MKLNKLLASLGLTIITTAMVIIAEQKPSYAWLKICNRYSEKMNVAFGYLEIPDNRHRSSSSRYNTWVAEGWYNLDPGECAQVYAHELWRRNLNYYYYAKTPGGAVWSAKQGEGARFCVSSRKFTLKQTEEVNSRCGGDIKVFRRGGMVRDSEYGIIHHRPDRWETIATDTRWERFRQITVGRRTQNHTLDLR